MKHRNTFVLFIFAIVVLAVMYVFLFNEIYSAQHHVLKSMADNTLFALLEHIMVISIASAVVIFTVLLFALWLSVVKPKIIIEVHEVEAARKEIEEAEKIEIVNEELAFANEVEEICTRIVSEVIGNNREKRGEEVLIAISKYFQISQGICYFRTEENSFLMGAKYAYYNIDESLRSFELGHGLPGQVALSQDLLNLSSVPEKYLTVLSGLGSATPRHLLLFPVVRNAKTEAIFELAAFVPFDNKAEAVFSKLKTKLSELV